MNYAGIRALYIILTREFNTHVDVSGGPNTDVLSETETCRQDICSIYRITEKYNCFIG
jgi:hypothetical protein